MVVTKLAAPVVERDDEEVVVLQPLEHLRRVVALEHEVAERPHPSRTVRSRNSSSAGPLGRALRAQIIRDEAVVAADDASDEQPESSASAAR